MPGNKVKLSSKNLEMPPLQEWLEFQAEQLKSAAEFFCTDIKNIVTEVVQKNKGELSKEDYKSYKISSLAMRQFRQSIEKTIANLTEMVSQADAELGQRFEKNAEETGSGSGGESESNRTRDGGQKEDDDDGRSVGEDGGGDSDGSCTTVDGSSPEKNTKGGSRDESFFEDDHLSMEEEEEDEKEEKMETTVSTAGNEESSINEVDATVETVNGDDIEEGEGAEEKKEEEEEDVFIKSSSSRRAVRSPSPAETVFMTPPSKIASKSVPVVRPPSPAETVALFSSPKKSKETPAEKRISRRPRSPSPAGTVLINRKKTDDSDDEDASARRSVLSSSPKTPDEKSKGRSSRRSPSPADTVMLGRRNKQESDSDDEDTLARRSVLSGSSKDRKSSKRSPSPADTVMLSRKKNGLSDSDDEDAKARRSVLSSDSKSSVNAPFKKPRAVSSKVSSEDEQVPSNSSAAVADESELMELDQVPARWQDDPKLKRNACEVQVERLEKVILDKLETQGFVYVYPKNKKSKKKDSDDDILDRAIKRLVKLNPIVSTSPRRKGRPKKSQTKSEKKKSKKSGSDDDARARDDSADGVSDDDEPVLTRAVRPLTKSVSKDDDEESHGSDDEELESKKESVSDDEDRYARDKILKGARKIATVSSSDEKDEKEEKTSKSQDKKEKRKSYYTPQVNVKSKDTSDEDSDDDFVAPKKKIRTRGRGTIRSDSEESRSSKEQNNKTDTRYSTEELSSDSESQQQPVAKNKRRRLSSREEDKKSKPKRRRVKTLSDSESDDSDAPKKKSKKKKKKDDEEVVIDSDSDIEVTKDDTETKGRKKIRGIISKSDLQKETRKAEKEEEERRKRIAERQSKFNGIFKPPEGESLTELVLDFDPETKKPLVVVDPEITKKLKRHQADGIRFMWHSCFESVEQFKKPNNPGSGCILAHCMGLGKTLQTVAFLHTVMTSETIGLKTALVICPLNTVTNWSNEVKMWTRNAGKQVYVHALYDGKNQDQKISDLKYWMRKGGVGIIHYDSFRALVEGKQKKRLKDVIMECLVDPGADIVVCDEGHLFKNDKSKMAQAVNKIRTLRRVVLTGTPLQNNLKEYHCMMQFVKPNLLGSKKEFLNRFVNPITNGQHKDSTASDVKLMKKRAHVLHKLLDGCVQRLGYSVLVPYLPPKHEYVISIRMTDIQNKLYCHYLESIKSVNDMKVLVKQLLKHAANLAKVYCHPRALELKHAQKMDYDDEGEISSGAGSLKDFIDDDSTEESSVEISDSCDDSEVDWLDDDGLNKIERKKKKQEKNKSKELAAVKLEKNGEGEGEEEKEEEGKEEVNELSGSIIENGGNWWSKFFKSKDEMSLMEHSSKMVVLFEILKTCESIQDKVLVFSQNLYSLDLIEEFLGALDDEARSRDSKPKTFPPTYDPDVSRWRRNIEYFRIDGSTKHHDRQRNCDTFNKKTDTSRAKLFLISTKAGGIGINLIGANRVVIFDASWNPSQDMQSIFRVFRFGQTKPCYVYRLLAKGTIEEKIYNRQVVKLALSCRVVDEHQIERHFTFDDIAKMFEYNPDEKTDCPTPDVPKDRLLADLLMSQKDVIYTYHEHDSLLQNQVDQGLTEDERKAAWEEYQNEKEQRVPNPDHGNDIQQAYDKMRAKIRLMYPNVSDSILSLYVRRIQHEMLELRKETAWFLENRGKMEMQAAVKYQQGLFFRKEQISKCFSVPGFLSNLMKPEIDKLVQRSNNALLQAQRNGFMSIGKNIVEGQGGAGPSHMYQPNSANFNQLFSNLIIQQQQQAQQQHRPAVQQQRPSIPTIPVPYHPSRDDDVVNLD